MTAPKPTILLTGANGGLGSAFVTAFLKSPQSATHHGLYTVRNPSTAHGLQTILKSAPSTHTYDILPLDLSSLESVRSLAEDVNAKVAKGELGPIRALVLNAGWQDANAETLKPRMFTREGYEGHFGINYLANFLLVLRLLQSIDKKEGRIVLVSSYTHDGLDKQNDGLGFYKSETGEFKELYKGTDELAKGKEWSDDGWKAGMRRYGASKTCLVLFMFVPSLSFSHITVANLTKGMNSNAASPQTQHSPTSQS
jgi:NAD(P)-dependent dehydrogenase (short-subunit alcohol dehydrogenase family)